jgi:hypothetical protein
MMDAAPWYGWIAAVGVIGWVAIPIVGTIIWGRRKSRASAGAPGQDAVLARLDAIDTRLAAVEKTLNDIP